MHATQRTLITRSFLWVALALATLMALPAQAQAPVPISDVAKGNSFGKAFTPDLRQQLVKEVPLVKLEGARVVMANHRELTRLGIQSSPGGLMDGSLEHQVLNNFAFRPATDEEIKAGKYTHVGLATRYADKLGDGGVKGDGRAALTGEVIVRDKKGGIVGVYDIQVKGVGTGLHPNWNGFGHRHGKESLRQATEDALFSDYLGRNGIRTNSWLAVIDSGNDIEHPDGGRERAGLLVRGGNFLRMAHWNLVRNDPKALRELVDFTNKQVSTEMGRNRPLSIPGLYKILTQRKANEMADMYFLRSVHGSTTYDNIGLMENMDHGTGSTVDRTHKNYSFFSHWVGYGGEPKFVMQNYYQTELHNLLMKAATPAEQAEMAKLRPEKITEGMLEQRMSYNALLHSGFSPDDARKVMKTYRTEAKEFFRTLFTLANAQDLGKTHKMGANGRTEVKDPARYDVFNALNKLAELQLSHPDEGARAKALVSALRPGTATPEDEAAALRLVQAFGKVLSPMLGRVGNEERSGRVQLMKERAGLRNRHAVDLVRQNLRDYSVGVVERVKKGENLENIRADLNAFMRKNIVLGPGSPVHAADQILSGRAPRTKDGRVVLSHHVENGVTIQELSDGQKDTIRISIAGDPLKIKNTGNYRMRFNTGGDWKDFSPTQVEGDVAHFDIPVDGPAPKTIKAAFFDAAGKANRWWNNGGRDFGSNIELVLGSENVSVALGVEAQRRGTTRTISNASLRAVSQTLYQNERSRQASRGKKTTAADQKQPRPTRYQRALDRAAKTSGAAALHTVPMKPRKAPGAAKVRQPVRPPIKTAPKNTPNRVNTAHR